MRFLPTTLLVLTLAVGTGPMFAQAPAAPAPAPAPPMYKVTLASGDVITGKLLSETDKAVVIEHPVLGVLTIPKSSLAPKDAVIDLSVPPPPPPPWSGSINIGMSGSKGNTDTFNLHSAIIAQHKTDERVDNMSLTTNRQSSDGDVTVSNGLAEGRMTWPAKDSPWGTFVAASIEVDKFSDYDERVRVNGGKSYDFINEPLTFLQGRTGLGLRKDYGAPDDSVKLEGVVAGDFWHKFSETAKLLASTEIYPVLNDLGQFTTISRAAWESKLAEDSTWAVRLGIEHRYDSDTDEGVKHSDFSYYASLGYTF